MKKKKMIITVLILVAMVGVIAIRHTWVRSWRTRLTFDGLPVTQARVYRNWSGDVLVDLRPVSGDLYIVRKSAKEVGIPNVSSVMENAAVVVSTEHPLRIVDIRTDKAGRVDPKLVQTPDGLSFRTVDTKIVQLSCR